MKTTDLLYQNQKVLNALQEMLLTSKKHIEFLAANAPEIRTSLESITESLQTGCDILENQIVFNRDTRKRKEKAVTIKLPPFFLSCLAVTQYKRRQTKPCISFPALLSAFRRCVWV